ncbi:MAG: hypothetical protein K6G88_08180 [Lachnospiraceae bacterium]|nr:hypothetical protein [Lachnospiraceae bacterium]
MDFSDNKKQLIKKIVVFVLDGILTILFLASALYDVAFRAASLLTQEKVPEIIITNNGPLITIIFFLILALGGFIYAVLSTDSPISISIGVLVFLVIINVLQIFNMFYYSNKYIRIIGKEIIIVNNNSKVHYTFDDIEECHEERPAKQAPQFLVRFNDGRVINIAGGLTSKNGCFSRYFKDEWDYYYEIKDYVESKGDNVSN